MRTVEKALIVVSLTIWSTNWLHFLRANTTLLTVRHFFFMRWTGSDGYNQNGDAQQWQWHLHGWFSLLHRACFGYDKWTELIFRWEQSNTHVSVWVRFIITVIKALVIIVMQGHWLKNDSIKTNAKKQNISTIGIIFIQTAEIRWWMSNFCKCEAVFLRNDYVKKSSIVNLFKNRAVRNVLIGKIIFFTLIDISE